MPSTPQRVPQRMAAATRVQFAWPLLIAVLALAGCVRRTPLVRAGPYEVLQKSSLLGLGFQPHYEFWLAPTSAAPSRPRQLLGVCLAPTFVTGSLNLPGDPSCFALPEDGSALLYLHRPEIAGADAAVVLKAGGLYRHTAAGDSLVYTRTQIGQIFSRAPLPTGTMRVSWKLPTPSRAGARCGQRLVISASGAETVEGEAGTAHCRVDSLPPF